MTNSIYKTPAEFDRAVKKAASKAEGDTGERYRQALRDRFLCRVFSDSENRFILKGVSGMLARVPNARATRDADFATRKNESPDEIVNALNELLAVDMGDYCRFALTRREESKDDNGYSRLLKLRYATYIGDEEKDPVLVDLSLLRGNASARKAYSRKQVGRARTRGAGLSRLFDRGSACRQAMRDRRNAPQRMEIIQDERPHGRRRVRAHPVAVVRWFERGNRK